MISNIKIQNFKALRDVDISIKAINIFTGLNGMGKSTVLQALMLLRQSRKNKCEELILNSNELINIGSFQDAFCESPNDTEELAFELAWNNGEELKTSTKYSSAEKNATIISAGNINNFPEKEALFSPDSFMYLSADRMSPSDSYDTDDSMINNNQLGNKGQLAPHYYHINKNKNIPLTNLSFSDESTVFTLEVQLNEWLGVISPSVKVNTEIQNDRIVLKYSYYPKNGLETQQYKTKNAGFGLSYVFSVLVAILSAKPGDIIIIENPESHIHPRGQSELARLMAMAAKNGVQIFVETHSDHIIYGMRIAIKEHDIDKEDVRIYYLDRDDDEHFSIAHRIEIDEYGRMERKGSKYFLEYEMHLDRLMG